MDARRTSVLAAERLQQRSLWSLPAWRLPAVWLLPVAADQRGCDQLANRTTKHVRRVGGLLRVATAKCGAADHRSRQPVADAEGQPLVISARSEPPQDHVTRAAAGWRGRATSHGAHRGRSLSTSGAAYGYGLRPSRDDWPSGISVVDGPSAPSTAAAPATGGRVAAPPSANHGRLRGSRRGPDRLPAAFGGSIETRRRSAKPTRAPGDGVQVQSNRCVMIELS